MAQKRAPGRLYLELGPTPLLAALHALHAIASGVEPEVLGVTLTRGLEKTLRASEQGLARVRTLLEWLTQQRLCKQPRSGAKGLRWTAPFLVKADVEKLVREARKESARTGPWHVTLAALRTLLAALERNPWLGPNVLYWNGRKRTLAETHARLEAFVAQVRGGREDVAPPPRARVKAEEPAPQVKAKAKNKRAKQGPVRGFGGLPDDAESVGQSAPTEQRGLSDEAQYFLREAGLGPWPCTREELERGRRKVLARLHPDRTHGASTADFQRAAEGARQLAGVLAAMEPELAAAPPAKASEPEAAVKPAARAKKGEGKGRGAWVAGASGQWPPPAAATG